MHKTLSQMQQEILSLGNVFSIFIMRFFFFFLSTHCHCRDTGFIWINMSNLGIFNGRSTTFYIWFSEHVVILIVVLFLLWARIIAVYHMYNICHGMPALSHFNRVRWCLIRKNTGFSSCIKLWTIEYNILEVELFTNPGNFCISRKDATIFWHAEKWQTVNSPSVAPICTIPDW